MSVNNGGPSRLRLVNAARRRFGSYSRALRAAGLNPDKVRLRVPKVPAGRHKRLERQMRHVAP